MEIGDGSTIHTLSAGEGPPVLLLHGYPQTLAAWHRVAPKLAESGFRVIAADLPGYGRSALSPAGAVRSEPSRRTIAASIAEAMEALGHKRFAIAGHDRGARAGYRLALDFPDQVAAFASLTVIPTLDVWEQIDGGFAVRAPHWFFFMQPPELVERLIGADPISYLDHVLAGMAGGLDRLDPRALADYRAAFASKSVREAIFADYRAALGIDLEHERADRAARRMLECPVLYLWSAGNGSDDPPSVWRRWAADVSGEGLEGGHLQPERACDKVVEALVPFLHRCFARGAAQL
ncbi:alpha/beta hydrolase [Chelativorans sp.]|uniref:alpha/beta hydrolase n=1 Tax=Chelativorans sp. TaxID=2203393 RepID=UPI0035C689B8